MSTAYDGGRIVDLSLNFRTNQSTLRTYGCPRPRPSGAWRHCPQSMLSPAPERPTTTAGEEPPSLSMENSRNRRVVLYYPWVEPNYFQTLGVPLVLGHGFESQSGGSERVVVSESAARRLWPGKNPIGQNLRLSTDGQFHNKGELLPDGPVWQVIDVPGYTA